MTKEQEQEVLFREEIKSRAIEYWEARRIIRVFDQINDKIAQPIIEAKSSRVKALCLSNQCNSCSSNTCKSNFLDTFNNLRRKARQIYYEHSEWFLENEVSLKDIEKYRAYEC